MRIICLRSRVRGGIHRIDWRVVDRLRARLVFGLEPSVKELRVPVHDCHSWTREERQTSYQGHRQVAHVLAAWCRDALVKFHDDEAAADP